MKVVELVFLSREVLKLLSENDVKTGDLFTAVYQLAVDKLKDADSRFNVRRYFGV